MVKFEKFMIKVKKAKYIVVTSNLKVLSEERS